MTDLIRAVFEEQADRAPGVTGLRAALAHPERHRLRGVLVPMLVGVVVAVVAGVAATIIPTDHSQRSGNPPPPRNLVVEMPYQPTSLPAGFVEVGRAVHVADRSWRRSFNDPRSTAPALFLNGVPGSEQPTGTPLPIGDRAGAIALTGDSATVEWRESPRLLLRVVVPGGPDRAQLAQDIARSVIADPGASLTVPAEFDWLPDRMADGWVEVSVDSQGLDVVWLQSEGSYDGVSATVVRQRTTPSGAPVTVRGSQGDAEPGTSSGQGRSVNVRLSDGRWLQVEGDVRPADLLHVADTVRVGPAQHYPWLGR